MNDIVANTVKEWRRTSFKWGSSDCLISLADYLIELGLPDFASDFRETYDDEPGAQKHIDQYGGELQLMNTSGLDHTFEPVRGDVVLILIGKHIAGLCTGESIVFRTERGVVEVGIKFVNIVQAWKVTKCPQ